MHEPRSQRDPADARSASGFPRDARLYLCTDARRERGDLAAFADAVLAGGVDIIQLRDKGSAGEKRFGPLEASGELAALEILSDAARRQLQQVADQKRLVADKTLGCSYHAEVIGIRQSFCG